MELTDDPTGRRAMFDDYAQVQAKIENPKRDSQNPHFGNSFVSLESLLSYTRPLLNQHGFLLIQTFALEEGTQVFRTELVHREGGNIQSVNLVPKLDSPQQVVSFSTYMRRVQLCALLGIRDEDDDDGNATAARQQQAQPPWAQRPAAPPPMAPSGPPPMPAPSPPGAPWAQPPAPQPVPAPMPTMPPQGQAAVAAPPAPVPAALPTAAPGVPPAPEGSITGNDLAEAQNIMAAVEQTWGAGQKNDILQRIGLPDISHMPADNYISFIAQMEVFLNGQGKSMHLTGPEGGNQATIQ